MQQNALYLQAMSIACVEFRDKVTGKLRQKIALALIENNPEQKGSKFYQKFADGNLHDTTDKDRAFVQYMKNKQWGKVRARAFGVVTWALAAVGMSLIAAGLFFLH